MRTFAGFDIVIDSYRHVNGWPLSKRHCPATGKYNPAPLREFRVHALAMNLDRHEVRVGGKSIELTPKEFQILRVLLQNPGAS